MRVENENSQSVSRQLCFLRLSSVAEEGSTLVCHGQCCQVVSSTVKFRMNVNAGVGVAGAVWVPTSTGLYCVTGQNRCMPTPTSTIPVPSVCVEASVVVGRRGVEVKRVRGKVGVVEEVEGVDVEVERVR